MNDNKRQFSITENNDWEGETFEYVMLLTDEEVEFINKMIESEEYNDELTIEESNYTKKEINLINSHSENTYMARIGFYEFEHEDTLKNWDEFGEVFYKGKGLKRVSKLKK